MQKFCRYPSRNSLSSPTTNTFSGLQQHQMQRHKNPYHTENHNDERFLHEHHGDAKHHPQKKNTTDFLPERHTGFIPVMVNIGPEVPVLLQLRRKMRGTCRKTERSSNDKRRGRKNRENNTCRTKGKADDAENLQTPPFPGHISTSPYRAQAGT